MSFNIAQLAQVDTFKHVLKNPVDGTEIADADGNKVEFTLYSNSSKQYRNAMNAIIAGREKLGNKKITIEKAREDSVNLLVAVSQKAAYLELDGLKFDAADNSEAFKKLYSDASYNWVFDQIQVAVGDISNFLAPQEQTS